MHFNKILVGSLAIAGIALSACTTDQIEIPKSELYAREFIKQFGVVDPNHDWNNATQGTVTVVTTSPTHVEVLADIKGKRYIFADYKNVKGSENISFTIPKGVNDIIVTLNGREYKTTLGGTVKNKTLVARDIIPENSEGKIKVEPAPESEMIAVTGEYIGRYDDILPENGKNLGKPGVSMNFVFKNSGKPIVIYPVMWNTSQTNTLGIYYYQNGNRIDQDIYTIKSGNFLSRYQKDYDSSQWATFEDENTWVQDETNQGETIKKALRYFQNLGENDTPKWPIVSAEATDEEKADVKTMWDNVKSWLEQNEGYIISSWETPGNWTTHTNDYRASSGLKWGFNKYKTTMDGSNEMPNAVNGGNHSYSKDSNVDNARYESRGIKIEIPEDITSFGMYIKSGSYQYFSESSLNEGQSIDYYRTWSENGESTSVPTATYNAPFAATFTRQDLNNSNDADNYRRVCFEDCAVNADGWEDFNDMIFYIKGINDSEVVEEEKPWEIPDKPEPEEYNYIIAAEDLGGTCDWDFNDMVVSISVISTNYVDEKETSESTENSYPYKKVTVTPLASGGTLPIYLMYTGKVSETKDDYNSATTADYLIGKEFHAWLSNNDNAPLTPLNIGETATLKGESITFNVPDPDGSYTLALHEKYALGTSRGNNMGGFWVLVINQKDTPYTPVIDPSKKLNAIDVPQGKGITEIEAPDPGGNVGNLAPQMICIDHGWYWPREGKKIHLAYPSTNGRPGFEGWVNDHKTVKGDWYGEGKYESHLVTKHNLKK